MDILDVLVQPNNESINPRPIAWSPDEGSLTSFTTARPTDKLTLITHRHGYTPTKGFNHLSHNIPGSRH